MPLRCNRAVLALVSAAKEEEVIVWLEERLFFHFPILQRDFS